MERRCCDNRSSGGDTPRGGGTNDFFAGGNTQCPSMHTHTVYKLQTEKQQKKTAKVTYST